MDSSGCAGSVLCYRYAHYFLGDNYGWQIRIDSRNSTESAQES